MVKNFKFTSGLLYRQAKLVCDTNEQRCLLLDTKDGIKMT